MSSLEQLNKEIDVKVSKHTSKKVFLYLEEIILSLGVIGILVPIIVDISINRKLTWSMISMISVIFAYSGLITLFIVKKNRFLKSLATYSILLIPFLYGIESMIDRMYLTPSQNRFMEYALPISALWLAIVWGDIVFGMVTKINKMYLISILFLLSIIGLSLTNAIAYKISWQETFHLFNQMIEVLEFIACAVFFAFIGIFKGINKRINKRVGNNTSNMM